jgi:hypothetical protein
MDGVIAPTGGQFLIFIFTEVFVSEKITLTKNN